MTRSDSEWLMRMPPWCPTVECYMEDGPDHQQHEHHVKGCPMAETFAAKWHELDHVIWVVSQFERPRPTS